ncbi:MULTISPECIES: host-nuclease inhibitor Gam family protein [unclassified Neisseria]|uniref:host-nuclease inhibitor Gam family protein n=1 Tax=unclassified Neisseria TaxID=2623750 RepID=UPI0026652285|nr:MULTISPECIES: host-nuclease inhibitor Gam family protein [unclassified Neisseria]MDO1509969.1 host-nuclease inhibitor Gam family protein [Neisseria sp. MVDL19-042950]MDO1516169.1 host-nuclease inhibitor Gam family protein [Neisseria sp. MVDL18-041461]MDO1563284.1 host-nuclease inhibitor Gam family protein [Neisseria sp. MVDL20-010259]
MAKTTKRTKKEALAVAVQSRDDASLQIKRMGDLQRNIERIQADHNDKVAELQKAADEAVAPLVEEIKVIEAGVHAWAEANRDALPDGGKVKFADLTTGMIKWRNNPPKCSVSGADAVLALLEADPSLERFIRVKKEVNRDAVLNEEAFFAANPVPGLKIVQGKEFFTIEPFNQELA